MLKQHQSTPGKYDQGIDQAAAVDALLNEFNRLRRQRTMLLEALQLCRDALLILCEHPAFYGDAPEFSRGGVGYHAVIKTRDALRKVRKA